MLLLLRDIVDIYWRKMIDLSNKTDLQLVRMVKKDGNNDAFLEIVSRLGDIYYNVVHKYDRRLKSVGIDPNDLYLEMHNVVFMCVRTFNPKKGAKLGTWIGNHARYCSLNAINARKFIFPTDSEEIHAHIEKAQSANIAPSFQESKESKIHIHTLLAQIEDKRIAEVIKLRYLGDKKMVWGKVAKKMGMSIQSCLNLGSKGLKIMKYKIKNENFA